MTPAPIATVMRAPAAGLLARGLLTLPYWWSGFAKLADLPAALAEAAHFGLQPTWLVVSATIAVQLTGSVFIVLSRWAWVGAGVLGVFTALATLIAHPFWAVADSMARFHARNTFLEHLALIGGLMLAAILADHRRADRVAFDGATPAQGRTSSTR